jgi:hypothetical protein
VRAASVSAVSHLLDSSSLHAGCAPSRRQIARPRVVAGCALCLMVGCKKVEKPKPRRAATKADAKSPIAATVFEPDSLRSSQAETLGVSSPAHAASGGQGNSEMEIDGGTLAVYLKAIPLAGSDSDADAALRVSTVCLCYFGVGRPRSHPGATVAFGRKHVHTAAQAQALMDLPLSFKPTTYSVTL